MRRLTVVVNYLSIAALLALFYVMKYHGWSVPVGVVILIVAIIALVSFVILHIRTRLWKLIHTKAENLDERQLQVTHESLRYSYGIFSIISLLILMGIALMGGHHDSMLMLVFASLLYLAHTLPAAIIAWMEKEV